MSTTKSTRITFLATPADYETLKAAAEREGRSLSNYILNAALKAASTESKESKSMNSTRANKLIATARQEGRARFSASTMDEINALLDSGYEPGDDDDAVLHDMFTARHLA